MQILRLENISKEYKQENNASITVIKNINLEVNCNESIAILGSSGSGKSTLLHIAGLLDIPTSGSVFIEEELVSPLSEYQKSQIRLNKIGFVYQFHHLLAEFDICQNVAMPALIKGENKETAFKKATSLLKDIGLIDKLSSFPSELSGGQKQRVAVARSLMNNPRLILADEPTGNLDSSNAEEVFDLLKFKAKENNAALIIITHNEDLALKLDRSMHLKNGLLG